MPPELPWSDRPLARLGEGPGRGITLRRWPGRPVHPGWTEA